MSNRHLSRTIAMQTLFEMDFRPVSSEEIEQLIQKNLQEFAPNFDDSGFIRVTIDGVLERKDEIDKMIMKYAPEWPLDQIASVDRNVLRVGIFEMIYSDTIPAKVAINEAIEMAKSFGGDASGRFINGVLGSIFRDLPDEKKKPKAEEKTAEEIAAKKAKEQKEQAEAMMAPQADAATENASVDAELQA